MTEAEALECVLSAARHELENLRIDKLQDDHERLRQAIDMIEENHGITITEKDLEEVTDAIVHDLKQDSLKMVNAWELARDICSPVMHLLPEDSYNAWLDAVKDRLVRELRYDCSPKGP